MKQKQILKLVAPIVAEQAMKKKRTPTQKTLVRLYKQAVRLYARS